MTDPRNTQGAPPTHIHVEHKSQPAWFKALAWIALLAGLLALLFALSHCHRDQGAALVTNTSDNSQVVAATPNAPQSSKLAGVSGLGGYLAGSEAAPRSFEFEKLKFDTAKSDVKPEYQAEVQQIAGVLKQYPKTQVRIAGYADARGSSDANDRLGKDRADAVKAALVSQGIDAGRIDTVSGGASDPVASNDTAAGQAENRRTELVVTSR